jgi:hypothetical protein
VSHSCLNLHVPGDKWWTFFHMLTIHILIWWSIYSDFPHFLIRLFVLIVFLWTQILHQFCVSYFLQVVVVFITLFFNFGEITTTADRQTWAVFLWPPAFTGQPPLAGLLARAWLCVYPEQSPIH